MKERERVEVIITSIFLSKFPRSWYKLLHSNSYISIAFFTLQNAHDTFLLLPLISLYFFYVNHEQYQLDLCTCIKALKLYMHIYCLHTNCFCITYMMCIIIKAISLFSILLCASSLSVGIFSVRSSLACAGR